MPPRPSQSTGDAPRRSPPTIRRARAPPTTPPAASHRHRAPDATRPFVPPSCRTSQCRPSQSTADAPRRSPPTIRGARAPPAAHTACRHAPSPRPRCDPPFCSSELPHECLMSQCRPNQSTGDAPRHSPPTIRRARAPPRTVTAPPTRPPRPPAPPFLFHPSCRTASRANATRANRRETRRDGAHRRSGTRRRPHRPPPRTITTPPTRPPRPPTLQRNPRHDEATPARFRARRRRSGRAAAPR